jgi:hypothetical protein
MLHTHLSSGAGTRSQLVADVLSGLSLTPSHPTKVKKKKIAMVIEIVSVYQRESCSDGIDYLVIFGAR